jgi:hypothetical protein
MITDRIEFVAGFVWITASEQVLGFWFKTYNYIGICLGLLNLALGAFMMMSSITEGPKPSDRKGGLEI